MKSLIKNIVNTVLTFIVGILGPSAGNIVGVFFISMLPIVELRGSIPVGYTLGLPWHINMIASIIGNMLPVPFILLFVVKAFEFMKKHGIMKGLVEKLEKRAMSRSESVANKEFWGLMIFVAIPLPGTGAWTGALIAALLRLNPKKSFLAVLLGVTIAAILITLGVYGIVDKLI